YLIWLRALPAGLVPFGLFIAAVEISDPGMIFSLAKSRHVFAFLPLYFFLMGALFLLPAVKVVLTKKTYEASKALFFQDSVVISTAVREKRSKEVPRHVIKDVVLKRGPGQRMAGLCTLILKGQSLIIRIPDVPFHTGLLPALRKWAGADEENSLP
ncbi:MAG TPA: PH domain-containing protein, partial [Firmicutes bacterium]|nr:PH domain-containing protein [Bacillota bacterium]